MAITDVMYLEDAKLAGLAAKVNDAIADDWQPNGPMVSYNNFGSQTFAREMVKGTPNGGGGGGTIADIDGLQDALDAKADLAEGKIPVAQLPVATADEVGVVKPGDGLEVDGAGALSVPAG